MIVSGSTVAVGLLSMLVIPLPFIRSIGIGGLLIPTVSVITAITLLPALLATLGPRINSVRLLPKRLVDRGHPEDGPWGRWARFVMRHPGAVATVGFAIVAVLVFYGVQLNPSEAQAKDFPGKGDAINGRQVLTDAQISPGVMKPFVVLVENNGDPQAVAVKVRRVPGIEGVAVPPDWRKGPDSLVEAFPDADGAAKSTRGTIKRTRATLKGTDGTLGGVAGEDRDFVAAVYSNFPYVLGFVVLLTFILLARAFRSIILPIKAVVLNLISLLAAYGIIVFIFQDGHGSQAIWGVPATHAIIPWIPLMIFAFLFGLSMDYEVFMLTRMREIYDETGDTVTAISLGLARTGKLVTSAALVLMFAFFVLSSSPGVDIKQFGIGLAAGNHLRRDGDPRPARARDDAALRRVELVAAAVGRQGALPQERARSAAGGRVRLTPADLRASAVRHAGPAEDPTLNAAKTRRGGFRTEALLRVALSHLALVCGKRSQNLPFLLLGHVEVVERSPKLSRDFVEDGGRDLQRPMGFFQAERSTARFRACIALGAARNVADPECAHELEARKPAQIVGAPFVEFAVLRPLAGDRVAHDGVAEVINHCRDGECTTEPLVQAHFRHFLPPPEMAA